MKKVVDKYFNVHDMYLKVELGIWSLTSNVIAWVARLLNQADTFIEFHFIKNGNQDSMKKMPIQDLKAWAHDLNMVVIMLEDPWKKQLASLVYSINRISDELALTSIEKGFFVKNMKDETLHNIVIKWNEFIELLKIKHDKLQNGVSKGFKPRIHELQGI
jgi:hypothetical protein